MCIICVWWKDATEKKDASAEIAEDDPLVNQLSVGVDGGERKDKKGFKYHRVIYKKAVDGSHGNDDFIDIPVGIILKIYEVGEL